MARGRKAKRGLDYFPMEVDMYSDRKIRKLTKRHKGMAVAVYTTMLCMIYKNGYYLEDDPDLPFLISELLPDYTEEYIKEVIQSCLDIGLFNQRIYSEENVFSSEGIQQRYRDICFQMKRKGTIDKYNLLDDPLFPYEEIPNHSEEIPFSSEENPISSEENGFSSEENGISSEFDGNIPENSGQRKIKEKKIKKEIKKEKNLFTLGQVTLEDGKQLMLRNKSWMERMVMNRHLAGNGAYTMELLVADIDEFFRMLSERMVERQPYRDMVEHFSNWLNGKQRGSYGNGNYRQAIRTGEPRPGTKIAGEGSVPPPATIRL
jgi:hypothetical protein